MNDNKKVIKKFKQFEDIYYFKLSSYLLIS